MRKYSVLMGLGFLAMLLLGLHLSISLANVSTIQATVKIHPEVFNLKQGGVITAIISNLTKDGESYDVHQINVSTIRLFVAEPLRSTFEDASLIVKFDATTVANYIWSKINHLGPFPPQEDYTMDLTVSGKLLYTGDQFTGSDTTEIIHECP